MGNFTAFDPAAIRELAAILREADLTEIELVEGEARLRLVRQASPLSSPPAPLTGGAVTAAPAAGPVVMPSEKPSAAAEAVDHPGAVRSPMVGIAYLSPEPGAPPFVTVGAQVSEGQTLLLIEAMKTFNQIRAPRAGTVTRILVQNGMPVEFDELLMIIE